jgi:hypothetical protein
MRPSPFEMSEGKTVAQSGVGKTLMPVLVGCQGLPLGIRLQSASLGEAVLPT